MKLSIRNRLFLSVISLVILFVALSWILNSNFLDKYYIYQKKETLLKSNQLISVLYEEGSSEALLFELESLERNVGLNIYIIGLNSNLKYSSSFGMFGGGNRKTDQLPLILGLFHDKFDTILEGDNFFEVVTDPRLKTNFLTSVSRLNNGDILVLTSPIAAITESTNIANRFSLITGLITIIIGGIIVFFYANRFTKPILELNDIAQRMATLDFSKKYAIKTDDEIEQLGTSINSLSDQLDKAISELKEDIEKERRLDKMRKQFVSNVSHELKTPIALIQGYAEGLKVNVNEDEENKNFYCDVIMDEAGKMNRLVRDLLDLSQIESGNFKLERTNFDINILIEKLLDKYTPIFTEKGIQISFENTGTLNANGDIDRIEQVIINYLNNAVDHVDHNKKITMAIVDKNTKVKVSVQNSGEHIPQEAIDKIWTSFYKVDEARTREYGGTGLGLSVVKGIMERHGNEFGVENTSDGVAFWFELDKA